MNQNEQQTMKKTFHSEMITLYKRIRKELKYTPPQLFEMINKYGGYEAAIKFIITDMNTFVFTLLWENQRLDLSVEAFITKPCYETLFPEDVIKFCKKRLQDYNYAPKVLPVSEPKEVRTKTKKERTLEASQKDASLIEESVKKEKEHIIYSDESKLSVKDWENLFANDTIFTTKNKDLILRMYLMGGCFITPQILAVEEGYTSKYPFKEVVTSIAKRIKATLKIDFPNNVEGKSIPWHMLFIGWFESNTAFSWSIRPEFMMALENLVGTEQLTVEGIEVKTEAQTLKALAPYVIPDIKNQVEKTSDEANEGVLSETEHSCDQEKEHVFFDEEFEDLAIPSLELDDMPYEEELYDSSIETIYQSNNKGAVEEFVEKPKREPLSALSMDDLIDSLFDDDPPTIKKVEPAVKPTPSKETAQLAPKAAKAAKIEDAKPVAITEPVATKTLVDLKSACLEYYGAVCDICGFDFGYTYGEQFEQLIDIYPIDGQPISMRIDQVDPQKDIIPICSNCKAVLTNQEIPLKVEELKKRIK